MPTPHPHILTHNTHIRHAQPNTHLHSTTYRTHVPLKHHTHLHTTQTNTHSLYTRTHSSFLVLTNLSCAYVTSHFFTESQSLKSLFSSSEFCSWAICSALPCFLVNDVYCIHFVSRYKDLSTCVLPPPLLHVLQDPLLPPHPLLHLLSMPCMTVSRSVFVSWVISAL